MFGNPCVVDSCVVDSKALPTSNLHKIQVGWLAGLVIAQDRNHEDCIIPYTSVKRFGFLEVGLMYKYVIISYNYCANVQELHKGRWRISLEAEA